MTSKISQINLSLNSNLLISNSSELLTLNHSIQFQNIINLQLLDATKFLQTQLLTEQNLTAILTSQDSKDFCETVVTSLTIDQPKIVSKNFGASDLLSDGGGCLFSHQSEVFFISQNNTSLNSKKKGDTNE